MKRHIRVIGALPARVAQHNQHLRRFTGSAIQVRRGRRKSERREAVRAMPSLSTAQRASQELSGNLFQLARYEPLSEKSPHTITPSYTRVTYPGPPCHSGPTALHQKLFHLSAPKNPRMSFHLLTAPAGGKTIFQAKFRCLLVVDFTAG